ncbi:MAG: tetratricopeptide repeat protein [Bacteroidota bacterium]
MNNDVGSDSIDNLIGLSETYNYIGRIYNESGKLDLAIPYLEQALEINESFGKELDLFISHINIGDNAL